jgi:hypothetical protein
MSPDKKIIVGTSTDATGKYSLRIIQMRGQAYTQADLAGVNVTYAFHSYSASSWAHATWTTDTLGNVTVSDFLGSAGDTIPPGPFTTIIGTDGVLEGGQGSLSYGKDLMVSIGDFLDGSTMNVKVQ